MRPTSWRLDEVAGEIAAGSEPAEVDDPPHARRARRGGEVAGAATVLLLEARRRGHRMDEVVGVPTPRSAGRKRSDV